MQKVAQATVVAYTKLIGMITARRKGRLRERPNVQPKEKETNR
jgi:hypothetical protein